MIPAVRKLELALAARLLRDLVSFEPEGALYAIVIKPFALGGDAKTQWARLLDHARTHAA